MTFEERITYLLETYPHRGRDGATASALTPARARAALCGALPLDGRRAGRRAQTADLAQ